MANPLTPDVLADPVALTRALVDIESVSRDEKEIADCVEEVLRGGAAPDASTRLGNTVMARTDLGRRAAGGARRPPGHRADQRQLPVHRRRTT